MHTRQSKGDSVRVSSEEESDQGFGSISVTSPLKVPQEGAPVDPQSDSLCGPTKFTVPQTQRTIDHPYNIQRIMMKAIAILCALVASAYAQAPSPAPATVTNADVLTFAYNLEVFEAQFYSCAATGAPIPSMYLGGGGAPSSCTKANLSSNVATYAAELAREETAHVAAIYNTLTAAGYSPVAPAVNIDTAFESAAEAAFNSTTPLTPTFNPYANDVFFLHASFLFEDLGASAYIGALSLITNSTYRTVAAQIGATEAYHSSLVRTLLYQIIDTTPAYNSTVRQITDAIVAVENKISGAPQLKYQLYNQQGSSIANVDSNALVPAATVPQVLRVVTLGAPAGTGGGFFPNNLMGAVKN